MSASISLLLITLFITFAVSRLPLYASFRYCLRLNYQTGQWLLLHLPSLWQMQLKKALALAAVSERQATHYLGLMLTGIGLLLPFSMSGHSYLVLIPLVLIVLPLYWWLKVRQQGAQRMRTMKVALPAQLDLLAMLLGAGQPLMASLQRSTDSALHNPLRTELRLLVSRLRAGTSTDKALQDFAEQFNSREIRLFISALIHARQSGAGLASVLREQARHRRNELFIEAEQKALEAPVKLMLPLLTCIFPTALILLIVVLSAKLMWQL
ncbi:hypothetical protein CWE09_01030 [Aliidiomarina minuta]|uniref:Type II secretion system protein GspF domain-containing protein n=1 Tax=Aliidiomarina minuta TaxID=880057 RepID=A0A432W5K4_9GAMM|nr:type II secretion system F family protein [Aliidiomarina minuta]RUO25350.1 hypothetical protein CWE09_01030 [Aliidiomarina minuta]